jgi:ABC-2 type transport system ATP-binding protein
VVADLVKRIGEPKDLEVVRPSLEDVYLDLVREYDKESELEVAK